MSERNEVKAILEKAIFDLQDLPESDFNRSARADLWYALQNHQMLADHVDGIEQSEPRNLTGVTGPVMRRYETKCL